MESSAISVRFLAIAILCISSLSATPFTDRTRAQPSVDSSEDTTNDEFWTNSTESALRASSQTGPQSMMDMEYLKKMDLMDVVTMENMTKATMKLLQMYDEQKSMANHDSMVMMVPTVDVSGDSMLEMMGSGDLDTMNRSELMGNDIPAANCKPYDQVVRLPTNSSNPNIQLVPSCIVVKRCGGCCGFNSACNPRETKDIIVNVIKSFFDGSTAITQKMVDKVVVKEHLSCRCGCKVQESDCNLDVHVYDSYDCQCKCKNLENASKCHHNERWDPTTCQCKCAVDPRECGEGFYFDYQSCLCKGLSL